MKLNYLNFIKNGHRGRASPLIYANGDKLEGNIDVSFTIPPLSSVEKYNTIKSNKYFLRIGNLSTHNVTFTYKKNGKS